MAVTWKEIKEKQFSDEECRWIAESLRVVMVDYAWSTGIQIGPACKALDIAISGINPISHQNCKPCNGTGRITEPTEGLIGIDCPYGPGGENHGR